MKISELIVQLLPLLQEHGDVPVVIFDSDDKTPDPAFVFGCVVL